MRTFSNADEYFESKITEAADTCPAKLIKEIQEDYIREALWESTIPAWRKVPIDQYSKFNYIDTVGIIRCKKAHNAITIRNGTMRVVCNGQAERVTLTPGTLAWILHYNEYPPMTLTVDHFVADNLSDNRIENLRLVTPQINAYSKVNNTCGLSFESNKLYIGGNAKPIQLSFLTGEVSNLRASMHHRNTVAYRIRVGCHLNNKDVITFTEHVHKLLWGKYSIFNLPTTVFNLERRLDAIRPSGNVPIIKPKRVQNNRAGVLHS